jgi:transposase
MNSKPHVLADAYGRPIRLFLTAGQTSDDIGARALFDAVPDARALLADRGDACIPPRKKRKVAIQHDAALYKKRRRIENMFDYLKDWRRIATRYDRSPSHLPLRLRSPRHGHLLGVSRV